MTDADRPRFLSLLVGLGASYRTEVTEPMIEFYWQILREFPFEAIQQAAQDHGRSQKFWPAPAELVLAIEGPPVDHAEDAWLTFVTALAGPAEYDHDVVFADPWLTATVLRLYRGWPEACDAMRGLGPTDPEWLGARKAFLSAYAAMRRDPAPRVPAALPGWFSRDNASKGYAYRPEVYHYALPSRQAAFPRAS